jgi:serine protease Do
LIVIREGRAETFDIQVGRLEDERSPTAPTRERRAPARLGMIVEPVPEALRERIGTEVGVRVVDVSGPAAESGIRPGDIITRLNNREVDSVEGFNRIVDELNPGRSVPVLIVRGETPTFLALRVPEL